MPLKLLQHKSYHPYKAENVARVERDKARAAAESEERDRRQTLAESEARLDRLREKQRSGRGRRTEADEWADAERATGRSQPLPGPSREEKGKAREVELAPGPREHINFWKEQEAMSAVVATDARSSSSASSRQPRRPGPSADPTKLFLEGASDGWYATPDLLTEAERTRTVEVSLERAYKDGRTKQRSDPLSAIRAALGAREDRKLKSQRLPSRAPPHEPRSIVPPADAGAGGARGEAAARGASERDRARALLAKKKRSSEARSEVASTVTDMSYQRDLYNPDDARWASEARRHRAGAGASDGGGGWLERKRERDRKQTRW